MDYIDLRKILSKNIKDKRKLLSLTQEKLAEAAELSPQTINDIEGCRTWVSDKTLIKLSEVLHTAPAELLLKQSSENECLNILQLKSTIQNSLHQTVDDAFSKFEFSTIN
ncbi:MAG: helix-turn-helix transcriptional regulator [Treponema sp.]|nr:helix-turn-helix transcriptional regulator [Treponema sp.]